LQEFNPEPESETVEKLLSGSQAAEFLGVKSATLYAYASRGLIESMPAANGRERAYRLSDLIKLRQSSRGFKSVKENDAAVWTGPVIKSSITEITGEGHRYRGQNATELAQSNASFEQVAEVLWDTDHPSSSWSKLKPFAVPKQVRTLLTAETDHVDLLKLVLSAIELSEPMHRKLLAEDVFDVARRLIVTMSVAIGVPQGRDKYHSDGQYPIAQTILEGLSGSRSAERAKIVNQALVLCADHELNASALAARIAASCDASIYSCLLSALGTFSGSFHGSASRRAEFIVNSSLAFKSARAWLKDYLRQFERIPGFGMELYEQGDPRARLLIESALKVASKNTHLQRLVEIVECVRDQLGKEPNLDIGLAATAYALGLPAGSGSAIFAVSRTSGWIAHAIEQRMYGGMIRPRARYIGKS
jgi:citrate synthase